MTADKIEFSIDNTKVSVSYIEDNVNDYVVEIDWVITRDQLISLVNEIKRVTEWSD